ncbi:hypothetical protein A8C56_15050 [Niabella ginsenosidivorans]|uniref:DUF4268 domain-containing protein n=1 Tax=Niabella ginsenosidivorans TaxID=1176587 RepID=A0A1A9I3K2_9BACT|nr:DUF4268 domain-containing protein [Niabella ginsenosidivorans]ANH82113.1 hypothetical protein A8C56_15050 [Niabella ginsenosidivorans]
MYSKHEAALLKKEFWTALGSYLKPIPNANGYPINWVNYKTGIRHIYFRTDVTKKEASAAIELTHPVQEDRLVAFEKMQCLKTVFRETVSGEWYWQEAVYDEQGIPLSRIICFKENVNIFNKTDWPEIIAFLKERLTGLDAFWVIAKDHFEP